MTETPDKATQALLSTRIIWAMMLAGQLMLLLVVAVVLGTGFIEGTEMPMFGWVAVGLLVVVVPVAHIVRAQIYKAGWQGESINPNAHATGTLAYLALLEMAGVVGLIAVLLTGAWLPGIVPPAVAIILQAVNYPHGKPMKPTPAQA